MENSLLNNSGLLVDDYGIDSMMEESVGSLLSNQDSLITPDDSMSFVELNNDVMSDHEIEIRRKYFSDPKNQADILLRNYIKGQDILVNRHQRRELYKEFYRNAKKGKYKKLFSEYIDGISKESSEKKFKKLNG